MRLVIRGAFVGTTKLYVSMTVSENWAEKCVVVARGNGHTIGRDKDEIRKSRYPCTTMCNGAASVL